MQVIKRDGTREDLNIENIRKQTIPACEGLKNVSYEELELSSQIAFQDGIKTSDIQQTLINTAISKVDIHCPDWTYVAQRLSLYDLYHNIKRLYNKVGSGDVYEMVTLKNYIEFNKNILSDWYTKYTDEEINELQKSIDNKRDLLFDNAGFGLMKRMYLAKNNGVISELPQYMHMAIAMFSMQNEPKDKRLDYVKEYYGATSKLEFINATPINANARLNMGSYISCIVNTVDDSTDSIMEVATELAKASRNGSGVGLDVSKIRSIGSSIGNKTDAAGGKIPFMKIYNDIALAWNQAGVRPGAFAVSTESWDIEIYDFIDLRKTSGDERRRAHNLFMSVSYSDLHMERATNNEDWTLFDPKDAKILCDTWGDKFKEEYIKLENRWKEHPEEFNKNTKQVKARDIIAYHFKSYCDIGFPFTFFKDNANRQHKYKHLGIIRSSNLCVTGDTRILTKEYGNIPIAALVESGIPYATCWNGSEWSTTELFKTSENQECLLVTLNNGITIEATPYHKWYHVDNYGKPKEVTTLELKPGMKLIKSDPCLINDGCLDLPYAYENGLFSADGCEYNYIDYKSKDFKQYRKCILHLYNEKIKLINYINNITNVSKLTKCNQNSIRQTLILDKSTIYGKQFVPGPEFKIADRLKWLAGLIDGDGCLLNNNGAQSIQITSVDYEFLKYVYFMLLELGISSTLRKRCLTEYRLLPTNKSIGDYRSYLCKDAYLLCISGSGVNQLLRLGYYGYRIIPTMHKYNREATRLTEVVSVTRTGFEYPTYCGNEPKKHMLVFNGQLTGNCTEVMQITDSEHTGVCNLGSFNLARINQNIDIQKVSNIVTRALDNFIDLTPYPSQKSKKFQDKYRSLGFGSLGEAEYIANKQIYYGSDEHKTEIDRIWKCISESLHEASAALGKEKGYCEVDPEHRNAYLMAIAPNSSSAIFAGTTNGLEPVYNKIWAEVNKNGQYLITAPGINLENFNYYQNAFEVDMIKQLEVNAIRQKYIDMGQSQNMFIKPDEDNIISVSRLSKCFFTAWKLGIKTLYYLRTKPPKDAVCVNCEN